MRGYFDEADPARIARDYPIGEAFLAGPARLSRDALRQLQERRFRQVMARAWQVPFYRRRWRAAGLEPGEIGGLDDAANLPAFTKADLMASIGEHPPLGDYHGIENWASGERDTVVLHTTSGTTGDPQIIPYGAFDREVQNALLARAYLLQGLKPDDIVHSVYGFGLVNGGHYIREALLHYTKARLLTAGTGLETRTEQQIDIMHRFGATVLVGFADYLKRLGERARERGLMPGIDLPVRMISGHLGQEDREALGELWGGARVFDWYGVGDTGIIAAEGPARNGLHLFEDAHWVELLDPDSGAPAAAGAAGNICVTVLFKTGVYPIVRFNTQDLTRLLPAESGGDITFRRIAGFQGRSDSMVKLRGINVHPGAVGAALAEVPALNGEYVCLVTQNGARDEMTVLAEAPAPEAVDAPALKAMLRERLGVAVALDVVAVGGTADLSEIERRQKPKRLIDRRPGRVAP